jgi:plasmid stabilization system protein ParE
MRIRYTDTALGEIDEIISYIERDNAAAAEAVAGAIETTVAWLSRQWEAAPVVYQENVRAKIVKPYAYRVYYVVDDNELIIRNVRSTRQQRPWEKKG